MAHNLWHAVTHMATSRSRLRCSRPCCVNQVRGRRPEMPIEQKPVTTPSRWNPSPVPPDQQGWRGLGLPEINAKRRAYPLLWNEQVLVCGLLLLPGERSIRHSHESGELSISFTEALHPSV